MEHNDVLHDPQEQFQSPDPYELEPKSPFDRFIEAITAPGEAFRGLVQDAGIGKIITWGLLIGIVITSFSVVLISSSPELVEDAFNKQLEPYEKMHERGELTDEQYEEIQERFDASGGKSSFLLWGLGSAVIGFPVWWVLMGLAAWGVAKVLEQRDETAVSYTVAWGTYLIALMISHIEVIVTVILAYTTGDGTFSLSLKQVVETNNPLYKSALGLINPFTIWWVAVLGTGIATIANSAKGKAIIVWASIWAFLNLVGGAFTLATQSLFSGG